MKFKHAKPTAVGAACSSDGSTDRIGVDRAAIPKKPKTQGIEKRTSIAATLMTKTGKDVRAVKT